jgi:hypothetical protein
MRLFTLLGSVYLAAGTMAMATGDRYAMDSGNFSTIETGNMTTLEARSSSSSSGLEWPMGPWCGRIKAFLAHGWVVRLPGYSEPHEVREACGRLWKGLRRHIGCVVSSPHGCDSKYHFSTVTNADILCLEMV